MTLALQEISDRFEILDAINAYSQALDQREWALFERAFTEDAQLHGFTPEPLTPAGLREHLSSENDATRLTGQHHNSNTWFEIDGDAAHTVTEVDFFTIQQSHDPKLVWERHGGGLYVDDLVRTPEGWRIRRREIALKHFAARHVEYAPDLIAKLHHTHDTRWYR